MSTEEKKNELGHGTTGHSWDGIEEWNNPLPRWWVWTFYVTCLWALVYTILFPAWPLVDRATQGLLGGNPRLEVAADIEAFEQANAEINARLAAADLATVSGDDELQRYAVNAGEAVFETWCVQCHGREGQGAVGYPTLSDDAWLWGGGIDEVAYSIRHGIRNETADARYSEMPAFGEFMESAEIGALVQHVLALSGQDHDAALAADGAVLFEENCAACHMEDGTGDTFQGAPDLTDAIWLYAGDPDTLAVSIANARFGVMPAWSDRLSDAQISAVTVYVHALGGGE